MPFFSLIARRPCPRRWPFSYYVIASVVVLFLLLRNLPSFQSFGLGFISGSQKLQHHSDALRPGDFIDRTRVRTVPDNEEDLPLDEPAGVGTLHDQRNDKFYLGGTRSLTTSRNGSPPPPVLYNPYPDYNSPEWRKQWKGTFYACEGPRGITLDFNSPNDMISVYRGNQKDFPFPIFGSYEALKLDTNVCADRCSLLGIYGQSGCPRRIKDVVWENVDWGRLQSQCVKKNANRYSTATDTARKVLSMLPPSSLGVDDNGAFRYTSSNEGPNHHARSAILVRTYHRIKWTENHKQYLRSLIMELSLHTGGEYQVFLMVDVKDDTVDLSNDAAVELLINERIPAEFRHITILFNRKILKKWYSDIEEHDAKFQHLQPVQIFSQLYHFDFYWQLEMDARLTGHSYHFLERAIEFAKQESRKFLWERNAYFYTPGAHGTWDDFKKMVDQSLAGYESETIWGPVTFDGKTLPQPVGPKPPVASPKNDRYEWGVGEDAELLTFLPIFDPRETEWTFSKLLWNLPVDTPRRASPITMWRMSHRLLNQMHLLQAQGKGVVSEMSAPTAALHHGLKAVYVPHPMWVDGQWISKELARIYNPGQPAKINSGPDSIWNWDHKYDQIMYRISFMFTTRLAEDLYRRWLGFPKSPDQYKPGHQQGIHKDPHGRWWYEEGDLNEENYGHLCFPLMFLHTVKHSGPEVSEVPREQAVPL